MDTRVTCPISMLNLDIRKEGFQLQASFQYWEMIENANIFHVSWNKFMTCKIEGISDTFTYRWLSARLQCLVHLGVPDKPQVSEIDLSQPRHETAFWWRHNGPVTSQLTDRIKWPNYPAELIGIYVHINTHNKDSLTQRCRRSTNVQLCLIFLYISIWFES